MEFMVIIALIFFSYFLHSAGKKRRDSLNHSNETELSSPLPTRPQFIPRPQAKPAPVQRSFVKPAPASQPSPIAKFNPSSERFVQVIFKKGSRKRYDYLLGDHEVRVNDFVLVPIRKSKERLDKEIQRMLIEVEITGRPGEKPRKTTCLRARVKYISKPGEVSKYARSEIIRKATAYEWRMAS